LSVLEREHIADGLRQGLMIRAIASGISRALSTVSSEVRRNADPVGGRHGPFAADRRAEQRARRPKQAKMEMRPPLMRAIRSRLRLRWSPKQISETLRREFSDDMRMGVSAETITRRSTCGAEASCAGERHVMQDC
jgi:IS30 family transposase